MGRTIIARMAGAGVALLCSVAVANAAEVKVLTAGALQTAMRSLAQDFERQTGNHVTITPTNPANVEKDMAAGQFDVVAAAVPTLAELDESGRIQSEQWVTGCVIRLNFRRGKVHEKGRRLICGQVNRNRLDGVVLCRGGHRQKHERKRQRGCQVRSHSCLKTLVGTAHAPVISHSHEPSQPF